MDEVWKNVNIYNYHNYKISNMGNLKNKKGKIIKQYKNKNGYMAVRLYKDGKYKEYRVHRLVMITFKDVKNRGLDINHIDGNKTNNKIDNLEWCTHRHNIEHAYKTGLIKNRKPKDKIKSIIQEQKRNINKITRIEYNRMTPEERFENIRNIINTKMRVVNE